MISDELGRHLHDLATQGERLSAEDQAHLESWYTAQDRAEMEALDLAEMAGDVTIVQTQVESATAQLTAISRRIQKIAAENAALRREISVLRRRLATQAVPQPA
jgi:chromosome segregation ATPase